MKTPVRFSLLLSFCCTFFFLQAQTELEYERPVSHLPFFKPTPARLKAPGCAALTKKPGMSDFERYKASHPPLIDFTYPEALAPRAILKMEARHCFGDVYYVRVFDTPIGGNIPPSILKMLRKKSCWVPITEKEDHFRYAPIISTIAPGAPLRGEAFPKE